MPRQSAGLLMYRHASTKLQFLLVHPGGPFWKNKDAGAWTIPKGEVEAGEEPLETARREFKEEVGIEPGEKLLPLSSIKQKGGKIVHAWAFEGDCNPAECKSNTFKMEWPPGSGKQQEFKEIDRVEFFSLEEARARINPAQVAFVEEVAALIS